MARTIPAWLALACIVPAGPTFAQTERECLSSFAVKPSSFVNYIAESPNGQYKVSVTTMSCGVAEKFRERLYVQIDKGVYDSEQSLKRQLGEAKQKLDDLERRLNAETDAAKIKAAIFGSGAVVATVGAIGTTAACASAVVNGAGILTCGATVPTVVAAVAAWDAVNDHVGSTAALKATALSEIQKQRATFATVTQQLDATKARNMKANYSALFVAICRAVRAQCL